MRLVPKRLTWLGLGAFAGWLFDGEQGRARRAMLKEHTSKLLRNAGRRVDSISPSLADKLEAASKTVDPDEHDALASRPIDASSADAVAAG